MGNCTPVSIEVNLPRTLSEDSSNEITHSGHSHEIEKASTHKAGIVKLNDTLESFSKGEALTANQGRELAERIEEVLSASEVGAINKTLDAALAVLATRYTSAYATYQTARDNIRKHPENALIYIVNDPQMSFNGLWTVVGGTLVKAPWDALSSALTSEPFAVLQSIFQGAAGEQIEYEGKIYDTLATFTQTLAEGKSYIQDVLIDLAQSNNFTASYLLDASGVMQQKINDLTGAPYRVKVGGYSIGERVVLANSDIVKSTIDGNTNNPNVNMTGWYLEGRVKTVQNIAELKTLKSVKNGDVAKTLGHTILGLGAGEYVFEALSTKTDNNGAYIASSVANGVWVLTSKLYFESFGVINNETDQSAKMQSCIDYADSQGIYSYGFEKPNTYCLSNSIVFKPYLSSSISTFYSAEKRLKITTNGAKLRPLAPIVMVKIHREHVSFDVLEGYSPTAIGATLLRLGLHNDPEYPPEYRRSASFFSASSIVATNINTGVQFCPSSSNQAGNTYGGFYHNFGEIIYRNVKYGLLLDLAIDGKSQTTRCSVGSYKHNGGSCAFLGLNVETFIIDSFYAENLNTESTEYPLASQRAVYIPEKPSNTATMYNHTIKITGSCEDVPYPIFCEAGNCEINIYPASHNGSNTALSGYFNSGYGGTGVMPLCNNLNNFTFQYQTSRSASVGIVPGSAGVSSLPPGMFECYGNIQYLATSSQMSTEGIQVLHTVYPVAGVFIRKASGVPSVFDSWSRVDKSTSLLRHSSVTDVNANTLKISEERVTYGVAFTAANGASLNSPSGGEFYGVIEWIPSVGSQGIQMAYGTYPDVVKKRYFDTTWSAWKTVTLT